GLVLPLCVGSLLLGLAGSVRALAQGLSCRLFSAGGTAVAGVVLFIAVLWPSFLGPTYLASRAREAVDPRAIRVVPHPGPRNEAGLRDSEWVAASRAALLQGGLYIRVISASVHAEEARPTPTKKVPPREYLFLRLRTQQAEAPSGFATNRSHTSSPHFENAR